MKASDIMTTQVVTVSPDTPVRYVAALLSKHRISALPVIDNRKLVGIVSEADLLHRYEIGTERSAGPGSWWRLLSSAERSVAQYIKSHARRARDVMTTNVVCVSPDTPIAQIARLLERRRVKRVPVLRQDRLVGIVSRSDLVQALAAKGRDLGAGDSGDDAIHGRLCAELERQPWWRPGVSNVVVTDGIVRYFGMVDSDGERKAARVAAESIPGVRGVEDHRMPLAATAWSV